MVVNTDTRDSLIWEGVGNGTQLRRLRDFNKSARKCLLRTQTHAPSISLPELNFAVSRG